MADDSNNMPPRPLTRLERALVEENMYFPPRLKTEIEDALKAIAVKEGFKDSAGLDRFQVKFASKVERGGPLFEMNLFGYYGKPKAYLTIVDQIKTYAKTHHPEIAFEQADDSRIIMNGPDFRAVVDCLVEGFINPYCDKNMPLDRINTDEIMEEPKSWVMMENKRRQANSEDTGTPGGGLGGK